MSTWIKICGITCTEDAMYAARSGADALGFVFHEPSPRYCEPAAARATIEGLPSHVIPVGVWFDEDPESIRALAEFTGVRLIQTYDAASAHQLVQWGLDVLPALDPAEEGWLGRAERLPVHRILLDHGRRTRGRPVRPLCADDVAPIRGSAGIVLAGGLNPANVFERLDTVRPDGVDVASGVEAAPGRKDPRKVIRFIEEVRRWDAKGISGRSAADSCRRR